MNPMSAHRTGTERAQPAQPAAPAEPERPDRRFAPATGIERIDSFSIPYSAPGPEADKVRSETAGKSGLDSLVRVLRSKRRAQALPDTDIEPLDGPRRTTDALAELGFAVERVYVVDAHVYVVVAKTGAGKSTFMVKRFYDEFIVPRGGGGKVSLACTQPRVNLAMDTPRSICTMFSDIHLGEEIGYITGYSKIIPRKDRSMIYMTTEELTTFISNAFDVDVRPTAAQALKGRNAGAMEFARHFPVIVVDEAHDQSVEMLLLLMYIRRFLSRYYMFSWCPLFVITSATIDPHVFLRYFGADPESPYNSALIDVPTRFPIREVYLDGIEGVQRRAGSAPGAAEAAETAGDGEVDVGGVAGSASVASAVGTRPDLLDAALAALRMAIVSIVSWKADHNSSDTAPSHSDIAVIFASPSDITRFIELAKETLGPGTGVGGRAGVSVRIAWGRWKPLYIPYTRIDPATKSANYHNIIRQRHAWEVRIICSTNLIEVGVNLPYLAAIIDGGRQLVPVYYPFMRRSALISLPISKFTVEQRKGRVGRTGPGTAYFLYSRDAHAVMNRAPIPSTLTSASIAYTIFRIAIRFAVRLGSDWMLERRSMQDLPTEQFNRLKFRLSIVAKHVGVIQPRVDIANDINLLTPISMDCQLVSLASLSRTGLLDVNGSIGEIGLQVSSIRATSIYEALLRARLMVGMVHPIDIALICSLADRGLQTIDKGMVEWKDAVQRYVIGGAIQGRVFVRIDALRQIYELALHILDAMANPKWSAAMEIPADRLRLRGIGAMGRGGGAGGAGGADAAPEAMIDAEKLKVHVIGVITDYDWTAGGATFARIGDVGKIQLIFDTLDAISRTYRESDGSEDGVQLL